MDNLIDSLKKSSDKHLLVKGSCLRQMSKLPDNCIDMVFCDLPYGTTRNSWDSIIPLDKLWKQYDRIVKDDGAVVLTAANPFDKVLAMSNIDNFKYDWVWHKNKATGHLNSKKMPMKAHEYVMVFYKKLPVYNPQFTSGHKPMNAVGAKENVEAPKKTRNYNHVDTVLGNPGGQTWRHPRTVIDIPVINNDNGAKWHPTQKPVALCEYFINTYSNEGDVVLDNTMGSGSTGVACMRTNRKFVGMEMDQSYFNKAKEWINREANELKLF